MKHNRTITISEHAVDKFIERFKFAGSDASNETEVRAAAERTIVEIWGNASYISDDPTGILFRNREFGCDFIVFQRMIKTLFPTSSPTVRQPENLSTTDLRIQSEANNSRYRQPRQGERPRR